MQVNRISQWLPQAVNVPLLNPAYRPTHRQYLL
jgi:hypothetical protein